LARRLDIFKHRLSEYETLRKLHCHFKFKLLQILTFENAIIAAYLFDLRNPGLTVLQYKFGTHTSKLSNQNVAFIRYGILVGCFSNMSTKLVLKSFCDGKTGS